MVVTHFEECVTTKRIRIFCQIISCVSIDIDRVFTPEE